MRNSIQEWQGGSQRRSALWSEMMWLQWLLLKVRQTNHESEGTTNSLIEEGGKEINEQEENLSELQ